jgi:SAM-dependent methyltransferase
MPYTTQELDEIERSALEAAHLNQSFTPNSQNIARYLNPPPDAAFPLEYAFYLLGDVRGLTVLDYGCGAGADAVLLAARGARVIGVDISPELIEIARKRAAAYGFKVDFSAASAYDTGLPIASVDLVFSHAILHHLDLLAARCETRRVLKPGGALILLEPVRDSNFLAFARRLIPYRRAFVSRHETPLKTEQLDTFCAGMHCEAIKRFRSPLVSLAQLFGPRVGRPAWQVDQWLLKNFPSVAHYATNEVRKLRAGPLSA